MNSDLCFRSRCGRSHIDLLTFTLCLPFVVLTRAAMRQRFHQWQITAGAWLPSQRPALRLWLSLLQSESVSAFSRSHRSVSAFSLSHRSASAFSLSHRSASALSLSHRSASALSLSHRSVSAFSLSHRSVSAFSLSHRSVSAFSPPLCAGRLPCSWGNATQHNAT